MRRRFQIAPLLLILLAAAAALPANATVRAWLDNVQVAPGDTVQLTLAHDGQTDSRPDLAPLKKDFDIVGSSTSSSLQIINGKVSSTVQLELSLSPKHAGHLTVPSVTWDSDKSPALTLDVTPGAGNGNGNRQGDSGGTASGKRVFLETEVDPKSPYVQAAVHVTVRVYAAVPLAHADLEFPDTDAALVRQTGSDGVSTVTKNGQSYQVVTRHYLLFPQHSGHLGIEGPTLSGEIPDRSRIGISDPFSGMLGNSPFSGMFGTTKPIRLHADPIELDVQPRPAGAGASYWLPARNVTLEAHWNPPQTQPHVGDPATLDLQLRAEGLTAAQLPDLSTLLSVPNGLKAYPDAPNLKDTPNGNDIVGTRDQSIALIADQAGHFTLPELRLRWWDTQTNQLRETVLPAQTLDVLPAPGGAGSPAQTPAPTPQSVAAAPAPGTRSTSNPGVSQPRPANPGLQSLNNTPWKWISLALAVLWAGTLGAWIATHKRTRKTPGIQEGSPLNDAADASPTRSGPLRSAFLVACRDNDAPAARRNLLLWANAQWKGPRIGGLNALAKLLDNPEITRQLAALDRACYAGESWDGAALSTALNTLTLPTRPTPRSSRELAPLYR
jgi:hypothetical protein